MTFLKPIFSKGTDQNKSLQVLSDDFAGLVRQAIVLLVYNEISPTDNEFRQSLIDKGINQIEANEILLFLPIAFVRRLLPTLKWHDTYNEFISDKKQIEKKFSETKSFQIILAVTNEYFQNSPSSDSILKIAGRSAEFQAINQLLLDDKNINLEEIKLTKTMIIR